MIRLVKPLGYQEMVFEAGTTGADIASQAGLRDSLAAKQGEQVLDLNKALVAGEVELLDATSSEGMAVLWHSTAHIMAEAIQSLYPEARFGIGPPIESGFYYDIDFGEHVFSSDDFSLVEKKMRALVKRRVPFSCRQVSKQEAALHFSKNPYKSELIEGLAEGSITFYEQGDFIDLCKGPHVPHTGHIKALKLLKVAGAYWRGDSKRKQLTRIYGISFTQKEQLKTYVQNLEAAKRYDHRRLGQEMELFSFSSLVGMGLPLWLPKGTLLREQLSRYLQIRQARAGYQGVITPHIGAKKLYEISGHDEKYGEDAFRPIETPQEEVFMLKPMNCPHHCEIYRVRPRSYRELPLRLAEFGTVYRYEQSGELHGLTRTRGFTQDDAHIFCTPEAGQRRIYRGNSLGTGDFQRPWL